MKVKPNDNTRNLPKCVYDNTYNGLDVRPIHEETPIPWDAEVTVSNGNLVLTGHVGPNGIGYSQMSLPLVKVDNYLEIFIDPLPGKEEWLRLALTEYGWL